MHTMQAADTNTTPIRNEGARPPATGGTGGQAISGTQREGQAFERLLALTADSYLQSFAQEIRSLVPGGTSTSAGRDNPHAQRLSVLQAEDAQAAMGMRASELSGLSPRSQRLGAQRAELARSHTSGASPGDSKPGGGITRETPPETNQSIGTKTAAGTKIAAPGATGGLSTSAVHPLANDLNGAAESRTIRPHGVGPLSGITAAGAALVDKLPVVPGSTLDPGRSGGVARQVADALLGRAGSASGRAGASARTASSVAPPPESPSGSKVGNSAQRSPRPGVPDRATRDDPGVDPTSKPAFRKLLKSIYLSTGTRKSTARMLLNPPELGRIRVDVRLEDQRLYVEIRTERDQARELLAKNVQELRQSLERHGVRVEQFELRTGMNDEARHWWTSHQWHPAFESDRQPPPRRTRHDPASVDRQRSALDHPTEEDESSDVRGAASPRPVAGDRRLDVRV